MEGEDSCEEKPLLQAENDLREHKKQFKGYEAAEEYMYALFNAYRDAFHKDFIVRNHYHPGNVIGTAFFESLTEISEKAETHATQKSEQ